jgi:hypothetical protein
MARPPTDPGKNAKADADGRFVFENLVAGSYDVQISLPGPGQTATTSERDVQPSRDERTFRVSRAQRCSAGVPLKIDGKSSGTTMTGSGIADTP